LNGVIRNNEKELIRRAPEQRNVRTQSNSVCVCVDIQRATETTAHYTDVSQASFRT